MLKNRTTYEIMNPEDVGWEGTRLVLGKHSGRAGFRNSLADLGIKLDDAEMQAAYEQFLVLADKKKRVTAADLVALVRNREETRDDVYSLRQWRVDIASGEPASASVVIGHDDETIVGNGDGNGPVDALLTAIDAATGIETSLEYYHVEAVTPGDDAQGQVHIRIKHRGRDLHRPRPGDGYRRGKRASIHRCVEQDRARRFLDHPGGNHQCFALELTGTDERGKRHYQHLSAAKTLSDKLWDAHVVRSRTRRSRFAVYRSSSGARGDVTAGLRRSAAGRPRCAPHRFDRSDRRSQCPDHRHSFADH